jgi:hypothetical protein
LDKRRKAFQNFGSQLSFKEDGKIKKAIIGKGAFIVSDDMNALMNAAKVRKETFAENGLSFIRRKNSDGVVYFVNNRSDKTIDKWVSLSTTTGNPFFFNPMFGDIRGAKWSVKPNKEIIVRVQLQPYESVILQTYKTPKKGIGYSYVRPSTATPVPINGPWTIEFLTGGPVLPPKTVLSKLGSWTELDGEDVKNFSGAAKYSISFPKPSGYVNAWLLNLGQVHETAEIFLNGKKLGTLIGPNFQVKISPEDLKQNNQLEIIVANLMANRISYMDRNNLPWKFFYNTNMPARKRENVGKNGLFDASSWKPLSSGLLGPVTLTPVSYE